MLQTRRSCLATMIWDGTWPPSEINHRILIAVITKRAGYRFQVKLVAASTETCNTTHRSSAWEVDGVANAIRTPFSCFEVGADQYLRDQSQKDALNTDEER